MHFSLQNSQTSKETGVDISIFKSYSILFRHIVKHYHVFVAASMFNFQFFIWMISGTLIDCELCCYLPYSYRTLCPFSSAYWILIISEMTIWFFSATTSMYLQNVYINDKFLVSTLLYRYSTLKPGGRFYFKISFTLKLTNTVKASNIFRVEYKTKRWWNGLWHTPLIVMVTMWPRIIKLKKMLSLVLKYFVSLLINLSLLWILHCSERFVKTSYLLLDCLRVCRSVLTGF